MKKCIILILLIMTTQTNIQASAEQQPLVPFVWNKTVKVRMLENLNTYKDIKKSIPTMCMKPDISKNDLADPDYAQQVNEFDQKRLELQEALTDNNALTSYVTLHRTIKNEKTLPDELTIGARILLSKALLNDDVQKEWHQAQKDALSNDVKSDDVETKFDAFRKKLAQQLAVITKEKTGIVCEPTTDMSSRVEFLRPLANLSSKKCTMLSQATLAFYQIDPFVDQEVTQILEKRIVNRAK